MTSNPIIAVRRREAYWLWS